ncbi:MAG: amylo-alpha-1,6-glucosidase, partial [Candidatus Micrarchaeia archaeon]
TGGYEKIAVKTFAKFYSTKPENFDALLQEEKERLQYLLHTFSKRELPKKEMIEQLVLSSDAFIVERKSTNSKSIIAGYHWFGDWGRDTLISLTGLTLVTGRFNDAKSILKTFASYMKNGLVPNTFPEHGIEPIYNTADASLLFSLALYDYYQYTKDISLIRELLPKLEEVVDCYTNGTDFGIGVDSDMLVRLSNPNIQLTWMDAKIGDRIVTPRNGKPVEINAFWYATLMVLGKFYEILKIQKDVEDKAETVKRSFQKFWNSDANYLFDTIDPHDPSIRPNALFALSIPFRLLDEEKEAKIIEKAYEELYTPYGIRTLSPKDPRYHGSYTGDPVSRDEAYHQGTAWPYLLRPFITSYCRIRRLTLADAFNKFFIPFEQHLADAGVGFISEIFDGDSPNPRGCIAQAWSVAELLRAYAEIAGLSNEHRG